MSIRTKLLSLLLAGIMVLSLSACSGDQTDTEPESAASPEVSDAADPTDTSAAPETESTLPADFEVDTSVEDLCLATAGLPGDFELFTVNGLPVSAQMYLYWLGYSISELESYMSYYGMALDWSEEGGFGEYVMSDALNSALMYALIPAKAVELGYDLTQEQIDAFDSALDSTIESMGGEDAFYESLRKLGIDFETFQTINRAPYYYGQLLDGMYGDRPTDADVAAYVEENDILAAKHILLMTVDSSTREPLEDSVIAEKKAAAEDILKQLQESEDLSADFDALMHQYSEDGGLTTNPDGYTFTAGEMVTEFEEGTRALEYGQISEIVESPYGYHIILRLDPDTETLREDVRADLLSKQVNEWLSAADLVFTEEYSALDPQMFYETFMAYQQAFYAETSAES